MNNKILLIGGGGHCRSIIDVLLEDDLYSEIGIIDQQTINVDTFPPKVKYLGTEDNLEKLINLGWKNAFVAIGSIGDTSNRRRVFDLLKKLDFCIPNLISKYAVVSKNCRLGKGIFISKGAVVNIGSSVGDCCIINTNSVIEHDCCVEEFSHISPGAILCGGVKVGLDSHIGAGSIVKQYITIGNNSIVGMGSIVTSDVCSDSIYYGNPCRFIRKK